MFWHHACPLQGMARLRVALPVWNGRVAPVFDCAERLVIVDIENSEEVNRREVILSYYPPPFRAERLRELGVDVLLCGAISRPLAGMISSSGVRLVPFIAGDVEQVLQAYLTGGLQTARFSVPGFRGRRFRFRHGRPFGGEDKQEWG